MPTEQRLARRLLTRWTLPQFAWLQRAARAARLPPAEYLRRRVLPRPLWVDTYLRGLLSEQLGEVLRDPRIDPQPGDLFERTDPVVTGPRHFLVGEVTYHPRFRVALRLCMDGTPILVLHPDEWDAYVQGYRCAWLAPDTQLPRGKR